MPSLARLTAQPLTFKVTMNEKPGAHTRPFSMSRPTIKQVNENGTLLWEVCSAGMVRRFRFDWQANFHYEAAVRLYRSRLTGKHG
jgi:hypothetical protein